MLDWYQALPACHDVVSRDDELAEKIARALARAEQRLAAGTYGLSIESGRPIPVERLEAFPTAERTIEKERGL